MKHPAPTTIDFETMPIEDPPNYPPEPVGVSIMKWGKEPTYYAWGHLASGNGYKYERGKKPKACDARAEAATALRTAYESGSVLFHNAKFDLDVAEEFFSLRVPSWERIHDTLLLLFLHDPNERELGLKPASERLLKMPPDERDAVAEWLVENQPVNGMKLSPKPKSEKYAGAYVAYAPAEIVAEYANGDVIRTARLFDLTWKDIVDDGMSDAYDRERRLLPILLDNERTGVRVDLDRLGKDVGAYGRQFEQLEDWVRKRLNAPELEVTSGKQLADAMLAAGVATVAGLGLTPGGQVATNKAALEAGVTDVVLKAALRHHGYLKTMLTTFMRPWFATARVSNGLIFTSWNQVKNGDESGLVGTRTGRLSSTPNFQNIPNQERQPRLFKQHEPDRKKAELLPPVPVKGLSPLPLVRSYVIPYEPGHILIDRDYSQQEPRILAHFEDGPMLDMYLEDPWIDFHDSAKAELLRVFHKDYPRKTVKNTNLGLIYGQGVGLLAEKSGVTVEEARELKAAILRLYPGLDGMNKAMKARARAGEPIRTWGGRVYFCEKPRIVNGRVQTYEYKLVNTLIQGSAGDCTKEAIINYHDIAPRHHLLLLNVHDQLVGSVPKEELVTGMEFLRQAMEMVEFDVPMLSEGVFGYNWSDLKEYDKKGKLVYHV